MKVSAFIATSLDGYIARPDGDISWLMAADTTGGSEDYGYKWFIESVDCLVMGRHSLEMVMGFSEWPYEGKRVVVLSSTLTEVPAPLQGKVALYSGPLSELVAGLSSEGCRRVYVDGGRTITSFINAGLLTDITITTIPILLGEGIPLFSDPMAETQLRHIKTQAYESGFVQSSYELTR